MTEYVLEILDGDRAGEIIPLGEQRVTLGRKASCTVQLHDEKTSGEHAEIVFEDGRHVLRDLNSRNGTFLDGRKVDEVILTAFDTFHVGRLRVQFKEAGAEPGLALHQIGQERLQRTGRRRGALGLVAVVVALAAAGGWYTWQLQQQETAGPTAMRSEAVPRVAGNKLAEGTDSCENLEAWELSASGSGFEPGGPARTGTTALMALRAAPAEGETAVPDHALARNAEPIHAVPGERLHLQGYLHTSGGGLGALRLRFTSTAEAGTAIFTGTPPAEYDGYEQVTLDVAVPHGIDRVQVEVLALLPAEGAEVLADDLALTSGGDGNALDLSAKACTIAGTGTGLELRAGAEVVIWRVAPAVEGGPLAGLSQAGLCGFSDAGATLAVTGDQQGFHLESGGAGGIELEFGSAAAGGVWWRGEGPHFAPATSDFEATAKEMLLGAGPSRVMVRTAEPQPVAGQWRGDRFALRLPKTSALDLVVSFDAERSAAQQEWRHAQELLRSPGQTGAALDQLQQLIDETPHDSALLSQALRLRNELHSAAGQRVDELRAQLRLAEFFETRGEYVRIGRELDALVAEYGERDIPQLQDVGKMREQVQERLVALDAATAERRRSDLTALADLFHESGDPDLEKLVRTYIEKHY